MNFFDEQNLGIEYKQAGYHLTYLPDWRCQILTGLVHAHAKNGPHFPQVQVLENGV